MESPSLHLIENVACTGCGCVCDDLRLTVSGNLIVRAERACALAEQRLLAQWDAAEPVAEIEGVAAPLEAAIERSCEILSRADYPLIYGLSRSTTAGQRAAVSLAEALGAVIDTTASLCHAPSVMAQQEVGKVTCTLGEVRNRADLVVYWGCDPFVSHPRHWERYSVDPAGRNVPRGRGDRFVVVADTTQTASATAADLFLPIEPGRHFETLHALGAMARGVGLENVGREDSRAAHLTELAKRMQRARYGALFFGVGLVQGEAGHCNVQALLRLVADLNGQERRWCAMRMRVHGNVVGAEHVMTWQTSYPFAVNMARGYPRYNPGEFSVQGLLARQEVDACLIVGSETLSWLSEASLDHLRRIPTIVLDPPGPKPLVDPAVRFRTAVPGIHLAGTAYRMDHVPIPLRAILPSHYPSDAEILTSIERQFGR
jgi:formylmethanofuran dehydrogenase subunit B